MADEPLKVEQALLGSTSEIDKLVCGQHQIYPDTKTTVLGTSFPAQEF